MKSFPCESCVVKAACIDRQYYLQQFKDFYDDFEVTTILTTITEYCSILQEYFPYEYHPDPDFDTIMYPEDCGILESEWDERAEYMLDIVFEISNL